MCRSQPKSAYWDQGAVILNGSDYIYQSIEFCKHFLWDLDLDFVVGNISFIFLSFYIFLLLFLDLYIFLEHITYLIPQLRSTLYNCLKLSTSDNISLLISGNSAKIKLLELQKKLLTGNSNYPLKFSPIAMK